MEEETNENKETPEVPKESIEPEAEPVKPEVPKESIEPEAEPVKPEEDSE